MKNMKLWRTALVAALVLTVMLSVTGGTIAWFTDTAESDNNIIKSGTLDVEFTYLDDDNQWKDAASGAIFNYEYWEPGYTQLRQVKLANVGDLAFQYQLHVSPDEVPAEGEINLAEVIDVYYGTGEAPADFAAVKTNGTKAGTLAQMMNEDDGAAHGILLPAEGKGAANAELPAEVGTLAETGSVQMWIALHMQEEAGNDYQNQSVGEGFSLKLVATQFTYEKDSFDNQYDKDSAYYTVAPENAIRVTNFEDLKNAMAQGGDIAMMNDIAVEETLTVAASTVIYGQGNELTFAGENSTTIFKTVTTDRAAPLTIKDLVVNGQNKDYASDSRAIVVDTRSALTIEGSEIKNFHGTQVIRFVANTASDVAIKDTKIHNNHLVGDATSDRAGAAALLYLDHCGTLLENVTIENNVIDKGSNTWSHNFAAIMYGRNSGHTLTARNITVKDNTCSSVYVGVSLARTTVINFESGLIDDDKGTFTLFQHMTVGKDMTISVPKISISNIADGVPAILTNNGVIDADIAEGGMNRGAPIYTGSGTHAGTMTGLTVQ